MVEIKRKLDGRVLRYACRGLELGPARAILLYRHGRSLDLGGITVPAGARSFGLYWPDRPYNIYHWVDARGATLACYCNAATETRLTVEGVDWLDLEADVLIAPDGSSQVLDLDEVPADLSLARRAALEAALQALGDGAAVLAEAEACTAPHR